MKDADSRQSGELAGLPGPAVEVLHAAPDAMLLTDTSGRIVFVNAQAEKLFGYPRDALIGKLIECLIPERFRQHHVHQRHDYFQDPKTRPMGAAGLQLYGRRADGSEFPAEISLSAVRGERGMLAMTAIRDVTDRKRAEEERIRLAHAEEAVRLRDEFFAVAAHELRSPLSALRIQLQMLVQHAHSASRPPDDPMLRRGERALRIANRLGHLVTMLLDVSRITTGRFVLELAEQDVAELVRGVVEETRAEWEAGNCPLAFSAPGALMARVDRLRIEQVVMNLLTNARKYCAGKPVEVRVDAGGGRIRVAVQDHGEGIRPEDLERIFERFEQVTPGRSGGLGLGLYISRRIAEAHGGALRLESEIGVGSTFTLELPVKGPGGPPPSVG